MISVFGATLRKLRDSARDASLSPDGSQIVFTDAVTREIWLMNADGGQASVGVGEIGCHLQRGFERCGGLVVVVHLHEQGSPIVPQHRVGRVEFDRAADELAARGGGVISIYYHPTEFVTTEFWDAVNFAKGAYRERAEWRRPRRRQPSSPKGATRTAEAPRRPRGGSRISGTVFRAPTRR